MQTHCGWKEQGMPDAFGKRGCFNLFIQNYGNSEKGQTESLMLKPKSFGKIKLNNYRIYSDFTIDILKKWHEVPQPSRFSPDSRGYDALLSGFGWAGDCAA